ncbi:MAG: SUMF1/EgtB/PvdO family nonheme iron enzyme [Kiritimatiellia bacterium]
MKTSIFLKSWALLFCLSLAPRLSAQPQMVLLPEEGETSRKVVWSTEPGIRYGLQVSEDLNDPPGWQTVEGSPSEATALAQQHEIEKLTGDRLFFRVEQLDEQPPQVARRFPAYGSFGAERFGTITIDLADRTGIDPASIILTVGAHGSFTLDDGQLSWEEPTLSFSLGDDTALGEWGTEVEVELMVADVLGNLTILTWSFELETEPEVVENLFVFGSPDAQLAGQRLTDAAAALAARFQAGSVRMNDPDNAWTLQEVTETYILLGYEGTPPTFDIGQYLANLTPGNSREIFYRQVTDVQVESDSNQITLFTQDIPLQAIFLNGSFRVPDEVLVLDLDEEGNVISEDFFDTRDALPSLGMDIAGQSIEVQTELAFEKDDSLDFARTLLIFSNGNHFFHPGLGAGIEIENGELTRFDITMRGRVDMDFQATVSANSRLAVEENTTIWNGAYWLWFVVGEVPVGIQVTGELGLQFLVETNGAFELGTGHASQTRYDLSALYEENMSPAVVWERVIEPEEFEEYTSGDPPGGLSRIEIRFPWKLMTRVYGLGEFNTNLNPGMTIASKDVVMDSGQTETQVDFTANAEMEAVLALHGKMNLPAFTGTGFQWHEWSSLSPSGDGLTGELILTRHPSDKTACPGDTVVLTSDASGAGELGFQWYQNDRIIPGATRKSMRLNSVGPAHSGAYHVKVSSAGQAVTSLPAMLSLRPSCNTFQAPPGFVRVPAGTFLMGSPENEPGRRWDETQHQVTLDSFYMYRTEVTWDLWNEVRDWAHLNGYEGIQEGSKGSHGDERNSPLDPVSRVGWIDVLKWLNAWSEMNGLTPVYVDLWWDTPVRTDDTDPRGVFFNQEANGYRLPTEAEWEYAARAGTSTAFAKGEITYPGYEDPVDPVLDLLGWFDGNSDQGNGVQTRPVGGKLPNDWGLYDMHGNVWEWCWDGYADYPQGPLENPSGPDEEYDFHWERVIRGGGWGDAAAACRSAARNFHDTYDEASWVGFRPVRSVMREVPARKTVHLTGDLNFGGFWSNQSVYRWLHIHNLGNETFDVSKMDLPSFWFVGNWIGSVPPGETQSILLRFRPTRVDFHEGVVFVDSNADTGRNTLPVSGAGFGSPPSPEGFAIIPSGSFLQGSPEDEPGRMEEEGPQHEVTLGSFYMQRVPVTWAQWNEVWNWGMANGYPDLPEGGKGPSYHENADDHPVTFVNWFDVLKWLNARSEKEGLDPAYFLDGEVFRSGTLEVPSDIDWSNPPPYPLTCDFDTDGYRLPTEAEWEFAARAGTSTAYFTGPVTALGEFEPEPVIEQVAWYGANSGGDTKPVGLKAPNQYGLYDMMGNVWEWCWDVAADYSESSKTNPTGSGSGWNSLRIQRGGSSGNSPYALRSATRYWADATYDFSDETGFRPVRSKITGDFARIPAGAFLMGSPEEEPGRSTSVDETQHEVTLTRDYELQRTQVTWGQWNEVRNWGMANGYTDLSPGRKGSHGDSRNSDRDPVTMVNWHDAVKWLNAWSEMEGFTPVYMVSGDVYRTGVSTRVTDLNASGYRLPTEAEWEYAARAGTTSAFHTGPITFIGALPLDPALDQAGWYGGNSDGKTRPVQQKLSNAWMLYDMHGNVSEWCWDELADYSGDAIDPTGPTSGSGRVHRGGSWYNSARDCRSASREGLPPTYSRDFIGFRPARSISP